MKKNKTTKQKNILYLWNQLDSGNGGNTIDRSVGNIEGIVSV